MATKPRVKRIRHTHVQFRGRVERRNSKHGRAHKPKYNRIYDRKLAPLHLEQQDFYVQAIRPDVGNMRLDRLITTLEWREESGNPIITGTMSLMKPDPKIRAAPALHEGHRIRLFVWWGDKWVMLWEMRVIEPESSATDDWTFDLEEPFAVLQESVDDFHYGKSKAHPHGMFCHEIAIAVARRYRIPLGKIAKGKHRIKRLSMKNASPLQVIQRAYAMERRETGRRFVMRWVNAKLNITPLRRNPVLYTLGLQLLQATTGREAKGDKFATAVTIYGASGKGRKKKKIKRLVVDEAKVLKYGYVHKKHHDGKVDSNAEADKSGRQWLKEKSERKKTVGVSHPGIAFLRRGDAVRVHLPEEGLEGAQSVVFCQEYTKRLTGGEFTMDAQFGRKDPYITSKDLRKAKDKKKRKSKREKKGVNIS